MRRDKRSFQHSPARALFPMEQAGFHDLPGSAGFQPAVSPACAEASAGRPISNRQGVGELDAAEIGYALEAASERYGRIQVCATVPPRFTGRGPHGFGTLAALQEPSTTA